MAEAPDDVLELLEFLVSRYDDIYTPFRIISRGDGSITRQEFEDGLKKIQCTKFHGKNEKERIDNIFRYLDPSGEGEVSEGEWGLMSSLWKEMRLSISEFVQFLERTFNDMEFVEEGLDDPLDKAWDFIDDDGSGEITEEEWVGVVRDGLHYFGPCVVIFHFLDKDDEGSVSIDEFRALQAFQKKAEQ